MPATTTKPTAKSILAELKALGADGYKKILLKHGINEPLFGVKIEHLQKIRKRIGADYQLALDLFDTGVYDAMYLAGLIADDDKMTRKDLQRWVERANSPATCAYTVAWVAAGSQHGHALALEWIDSKNENTATAGWNTLSGLVALKDDAELDLKELTQLLHRVVNTIHAQPDRARYAMNAFVIAVGAYVKPLTAQALAAAKKIGRVTVDMGQTACKVPDAGQYIDKAKQRGTIGKKRKTVKC
jgi:3-methyladenine DNA glycosylase AlkD